MYFARRHEVHSTNTPFGKTQVDKNTQNRTYYNGIDRL